MHPTLTKTTMMTTMTEKMKTTMKTSTMTTETTATTTMTTTMGMEKTKTMTTNNNDDGTDDDGVGRKGKEPHFFSLMPVLISPAWMSPAYCLIHAARQPIVRNCTRRCIAMIILF